MSQASLSYSVSPMDTSEISFIMSSWKRSYREACPEIRTDDFYRLQGVVCDEIFSRYPTILVARTGDGVALGWIVAEESSEALTIHYLYVKSAYRRMGVGKALLSAALDKLEDAGPSLTYTHKTRAAPIAARYGFNHVPVGRFLRGAEK